MCRADIDAGNGVRMMTGIKVDGALFPGVDSLSLYEMDLAMVPKRAKYLETQGWDGIFTLETTIDPFFNLLLAAEHTERVDLITGVAIAFARTPMTMALSAWNLQKYSEGRLILGLGSQVKAHIKNRFSMPWYGPARQIREYILAMRAIWRAWEASEPLEFRGAFYRHTLMNPVFDPGPINHPPPPIYLGAFGPKMVGVAAEVADGMYGHPFSTVKYTKEVQLPVLREGLSKSGRSIEDFVFSSMVVVVTGRNEQEKRVAERAARRLLAFYASTPAYYPVLDLHGWGDIGPRLNLMSKEGRWQEMPELVTDDMLRHFCVMGEPRQIPELVVQRHQQLSNRVTLYAPYPSDPGMWSDIVDGIRNRGSTES